jgi:antitoxin (DNA-binding transcriptional repressor) of toxin-antitoxin stability system
MKVTAQYAEEHFADILHTAVSGEDVEIATPEQSVRMSLVKSPATAAAGIKVRPLGRLKGLMELPTDAEWAAMGKQVEDQILNAPLVSSGEI